MGNNGCCNVPPSCDSKEAKSASSCSTEKSSCGTTEKKCCYSTLIKGALVGGIVMFLAYWASWDVLPFHKQGMHTFKNEAAVAKVLNDNTDVSGVYVLPAPTSPSAEPAKNAVTKPFAFTSVKKEGMDSGKDAMNKQIGKQLALCLVLAGLLTCLLKCKSECGCPVLYSAKVGLFAGLLSCTPGVIWFGFSSHCALIAAIETTVITALAGLAISKIVLKQPGMCGTKSDGDCGTKKGSCGA